MEKLISLLKNFNFTESESKIYIALLQNGQASGYEISKISGVPRSKVYNILETLVKKGVVIVTHIERSSIYKAESVECVISRLKKENQDILLELENELNNFDEEIDTEKIWQVKGYNNIINKVISIIERAESEILIQIWVDDLTKEFEEILMKKQEELKDVLVVLYDSKEKYETKISNFYKHGFEEKKLNDVGGKWITITVDSNEMVYANIANEKVSEGIYTRNSSMVFFANEYIKHDAYCIKLIESMTDEQKKNFGSKMIGVTELFNTMKR